jgi:2,4-dienoyl-CoA reductase-like NADH-dependent reductase (Old Yellow Enzyme family)
MATSKATSDGEVTEGLIKHYTERARGVGLIIVEHSYINNTGKLSPNQLGIYDDRLVPGLSKLVKAVHSHETPITSQINHAGGRTTSSVIGAQPVAPSSVLVFQETPRELNIEKIDELVEAFGRAARRAVEAGFDAIEVHGAHGFLLNQFLSPLTNKRKDEYGGNLEKRTRFPIRVFEKVREEVGPGFPLLYRLGADDFKEGGLSLGDTKVFAEMLVGAGVDAIDVSSGIVGSNPPGVSGQGYLFHLAEGIKKAVKVPVVGVGGVAEPEFADKAVREEKVDLVAVGRALLADSEWAVKAVKTLKRK